MIHTYYTKNIPVIVRNRDVLTVAKAILFFPAFMDKPIEQCREDRNANACCRDSGIRSFFLDNHPLAFAVVHLLYSFTA